MMMMETMMIMTIQVTSTDHHASEGVVHTLDKVWNFDAFDWQDDHADDDNGNDDDHDDDHADDDHADDDHVGDDHVGNGHADD